MGSEDKFWANVVLGVALLVMLTIFGGMLIYNNRLEIMASKGYCDTQLEHTLSTAWQKCK
jgi:hypothetical protein